MSPPIIEKGFFTSYSSPTRAQLDILHFNILGLNFAKAYHSASSHLQYAILGVHKSTHDLQIITSAISESVHVFSRSYINK